MNTSEDSEMLELCEPEIDDLKAPEDAKGTAPPEPNTDVFRDPKTLPEDHKTQNKKDLYISMELNLKDPKIATYVRLDAIFITGVDHMSTKDVYRFFEPMKPIALEWINDSSCNAVWQDEDTAAEAIYRFSQPSEEKVQTEPTSDVQQLKQTLQGTEKDEVKDLNQIVVVEEDDEDEGSEEGELTDQKETVKTIWRVASTEDKRTLKLRFATWDDKKVRGAEKYSEYYKKHGNPNFGGLRGLISNSRKRRFRQDFAPEDFSDECGASRLPEEKEDARLRLSQITSEKSERSERREEKPKRPKMKMYADEEEKKAQRKKSSKVLSRLGSITVNFSIDREDRDYEYEDNNDAYDELEMSSPQEFGSKSVWDRLQVEVPNTRYSSGDDKKRSHRGSEHKSSDGGSQRDLRKKLQRIRDNKKDHRSPLLLPTSTK